MIETANKFLLAIVLVGGMTALGWLCESLDMTWAVVLPLAVLLFSASVRPLMVSHELVVVLLLFIGAATAVGTFALDVSVYGEIWFHVAFGLLIVNNVLCIVTRLTRPRGFWLSLIHVSVLFVLVGGFVKGQWKEEGSVNLMVGHSSNVMGVTRVGVPTGDRVQMPFALRLDDFVVEFYDAEEEILIYDLTVTADTPVASVGGDPGSSAEVGGVKVVVGERGKKMVKPRPGHPPIEVDSVAVTVGGAVVPVPTSGQGVREGETGLVFHQKRGAPRLFRSTLTILDEDGLPVRTQDVEVNSPLIHEGWWLYQANWGQTRRGLHSGIQLVHDPGLPYVFLGTALMLLAMVVQLVVLRRRKRV